MPDASPAHLMAEARRGDPAAFEAIIQPLLPIGFRLAYAMLNNPNEAEDAVQDAALIAWRRLGNVREGTDLGPWFLGVVANRCRAIRASRWWSLIRMATPPEPRPTVRSDSQAEAVDVLAALQRLGHDQRLVIALRYYLDLPFEEIGRRLGLSPDAAKSRLHRALRQLRPLFEIQEDRQS